VTNARPHGTPPGWQGVPLDDLPWAVLIRVAVCRGVLCMLLALIAFSFIPRPFGFTGTTIVSGSMSPTIQPGDVTLVASVDEYLVGQVILFPNPARPDQRLLHRIVEIRDDGMLVTKGDANTMEDSTPVDPSTVIGVGRILVPLIGLPIHWAGKGSVLLVIAAVVMSALLIRGALTIEFLPTRRKRDASRTLLEATVLTIVLAVAVAVIVLGGFRSSFAGFTVRSGSSASWVTTSTQPAATCSITMWTLNTWPGSAIVTFNVRNETDAAIDPAWTLTWNFQGDEQVLVAFIGQITQTGRSATYVAPTYMNIPPHEVAVGNPPQFQMTSATNTFTQPIDFRLNGKPCVFLPEAYSSTVIPSPPGSTATLPPIDGSADSTTQLGGIRSVS
jgi:signal peptidase I